LLPNLPELFPTLPELTDVDEIKLISYYRSATNESKSHILRNAEHESKYKS